ncbi:MAG TPA: DUF1330 domain-containing protein [Stellaceae bacterium]|nr:DUF1330 domain-containing protein [Stellaceae bacterium]
MAGYLIANLDITDPAKYDDYRQQVGKVVAQYGGRFLVRGGEMKVLEGKPAVKRLVVLEFPTVAAAQKFYDSPEYRPLIPLRKASTVSTVFLVEGA